MKPKLLTIGALALLLLLALGTLSRHLRTEEPMSGLAVDRLMQLPVLEGGRVKPLDTVARNALLVINRKQHYVSEEDKKVPASDWLAELMLDQQSASQRKIFRIDHPEIVGLLGFHNEEQKFFSLAEIAPHIETLQEQFALIDEEPARRTVYQRELLKLYNALSVYDGLASTFIVRPLFGDPQTEIQNRDRVLEDLRTLEPGDENYANAANAWRLMEGHYLSQDRSKVHTIFPDGSEDWMTVAAAMAKRKPANELLKHYAAMATSFKEGNKATFSTALDGIEGVLHTIDLADSKDLRLEYRFNHFAPFVFTLEIYLIAFFAVLLGWLFLPRTFIIGGLVLLTLGFIFHTFGMWARMEIQNRPPVTNLYSSAIFVGWGSALLCLVLEFFRRDGIATAAAALIGVPTLIIAHHLSLSGDTMEMMRAVLDHNFWLATHVIVVTAGYSATFLGGVLAILYIFHYLYAGKEGQNLKAIERMVYGIICFALLFSFVGTILGGIWADQSWGRFWGWDPKENGALMIVLWNALILHARWAKVAKPIGLMQLAITGNIITAWSWFGTNLLGVGLHSYGFTESGFFWLMAFAFSQVAIICVAFIPTIVEAIRKSKGSKQTT
jgi:ABC-type transport system involved in cytochrome c biogenesis permease subunit|tara:strand:+ start:8710 stop:10542 length:1833 start_codon:yes stop_codon:yes gene_type:complete